METMSPNAHNPEPETREELETLYLQSFDLNEKLADFDREYYFSLLDSGDFEWLASPAVRKPDRSSPDYEERRRASLEISFSYFRSKFDEYLRDVHEDSPVHPEIAFLKEATRRVYEKAYRKEPLGEAFEGPEELARYKELLAKYLYENFHSALARAKEEHSADKLSAREIDALLSGVTKGSGEEK